jgi:hypothetical protein
MNKTNIASSDISVIVQGPVHSTQTKKTLQSIRKNLPDAEIILSTWENSNLDGLDFNTLVLNKDPGTKLIKAYKSKKIFDNLNRQLISTQEGLKKATKKYTLKLRSDLIISNTLFLDNFDGFEARTSEYKLFEHKVLIPMLFTRHNYRVEKNKKVEMPFHISDWWFFGLTTDIKTYFEQTELVDNSVFPEYFNLVSNIEKKNPYGKLKNKFAPEQYFAYSCFARAYKDIYMEDAADVNGELMCKFKKCLLNNFIVLDFKHSGIYSNKYCFSKCEKFIGDQYIDLYNPYRFQKDYKEICDKEFLVTESPILEDTKTYSRMNIYKHFYRIIDTNIGIFIKIEELLLGLPLAILKFIIEIFKSFLKIRKFENE